MNKGFTLLEVIVVVSIISILSFIGINSVNSFRQEALVDGTVNEFVSEVKSARNKSMAGEIPEGLPVDDFSVEGLPKYSVEVSTANVSAGTYYLVYTGSHERWCRDPNGIWNSDFEICQKYLTLPSELSITPGVIGFARISGKTTHVIFTIQKTTGSLGKTIDISSDGLVTINDI